MQWNGAIEHGNVALIRPPFPLLPSPRRLELLSSREEASRSDSFCERFAFLRQILEACFERPGNRLRPSTAKPWVHDECTSCDRNFCRMMRARSNLQSGISFSLSLYLLR